MMGSGITKFFNCVGVQLSAVEINLDDISEFLKHIGLVPTGTSQSIMHRFRGPSTQICRSDASSED